MSMEAMAKSIISEQWEGWGTDQREQVADLIKALTANETQFSYKDTTGGSALQPQSLESTLAMLTFQDQKLKFWKRIGVQKAYSTLEEYTKNEGYGTEGGFVQQMENPEEDDAALSRGTIQIKFVRTMWKVGEVLGRYVRTIANAEVVQVQAAIMRLLRIVEKQLFYGNSTMIPEQFDGLLKAATDLNSTDHVIDCNGATITETLMKQGAEVISANYGTPGRMYLSNGVQTAIDLLLAPSTSTQRLVQNQLGADGTISLGHRVNKMHTSFGDFGFEPDIFIAKETWGVPKVRNSTGVIVEGATSNKAPATPSFTLTANTTVTGSKWSATAGARGGRIAGEYIFRVCAVNRFGKSVAQSIETATVVAAGSFSLTITEGGGTYAATAYEIYSTKIPSTTVADCRYLTTVAVTGASDTYIDLAEDLPGTSIAFLIDETSVGEMRTMAFKQLAPLFRSRYAKVGPFDWGTTSLYGAPVFYAPRRIVAFKNIGVQAGYSNVNRDL